MICKQCCNDNCDECDDTTRERRYFEWVADYLGPREPNDDDKRIIEASRPYRGCDCAHGCLIEQSPDDDPTVPAYIDALPPEDPRRLKYERDQRRAIDSRSLPQEGVAAWR